MDVGLFLREAVTVLVPMLLSLTVHEYAHAWAANKLGDDTALRMGRLSLSPLPHIDPIGTIGLPLVSLFVSGAVGGHVPFLGWAKPVPVNPVRFTRRVSMRTGMLLVAAAGPVVNLLLALLVGAVLSLLAHAGSFDLPEALNTLLWRLFSINISLFIFNMLPVYPLDGEKVVAGLLPTGQAMAWERFNMRFGTILLMAVIFFAPNLLAVPFRIVSTGILAVVGI